VERRAGHPASFPWSAPLVPPPGEALPTSLTPSFCGLFAAPSAQALAERSVYAYSTFIYAWMSELPVEAALLAYAGLVFKAASRVADAVARDRAEPVAETVFRAAYRTTREVHRLAGLLRFAGDEGRYTAHCAPDCFVFPALAPHFYGRFGSSPWAIIDERRALALFCPSGAPGPVSLEPAPENVSRGTSDGWQALWAHYHNVISNESRANPRLQRQFMPERYWRYLPEFSRASTRAAQSGTLGGMSGTGIGREAAWDLLRKYNSDAFHLRHALTVEAVMRELAVELGYGEEADFWAIVGLLHDIDFERWPQEHCARAPELLRELAADAEEEKRLIHAVTSHGWGICPLSPEPEHEMEKALFACDELTGLIWAAALMRPSKSTQDMEVRSVRKKFKTPAFAAGCSRPVIEKGAALLGWDLDTLISRTLEAMKKAEPAIEAAARL